MEGALSRRGATPRGARSRERAASPRRPRDGLAAPGGGKGRGTAAGRHATAALTPFPSPNLGRGTAAKQQGGGVRWVWGSYLVPPTPPSCALVSPSPKMGEG